MRQRRIGRAVAFLTLATSLLMVGCGGPSSVAEKPGANATASEKSLSKATLVLPPVSGQAAETANRDKAAASTGNETPAVASFAVPASERPAPPKPLALTEARQLASVLDLRKLTAPDGSTLGATSATRPQVGVPLSVVPAVEYYLSRLRQLGWNPVDPKTAESITEALAQVSLGKDGYLLRLTALPGKPKESNVTLEHLGNLDARRLPRLDGAEDQYSTQSNSLYFARGKVDEATAALRRLLRSDGWQEYDQASSQNANRSDSSDSLFRKSGYSVRASINKPATQPDKVAVQYRDRKSVV